MQEPKISDILWTAANKYLWHDIDDTSYTYDCYKSPYSCDAVMSALNEFYPHYTVDADRIKNRVYNYLFDLGLPRGSYNAFQEFDNDHVFRQGCRYSWLMFAAMIAEEEGV